MLPSIRGTSQEICRIRPHGHSDHVHRTYQVHAAARQRLPLVIASTGLVLWYGTSYRIEERLMVSVQERLGTDSVPLTPQGQHPPGPHTRTEPPLCSTHRDIPFSIRVASRTPLFLYRTEQGELQSMTPATRKFSIDTMNLFCAGHDFFVFFSCPKSNVVLKPSRAIAPRENNAPLVKFQINSTNTQPSFQWCFYLLSPSTKNSYFLDASDA